MRPQAGLGSGWHQRFKRERTVCTSFWSRLSSINIVKLQLEACDKLTSEADETFRIGAERADTQSMVRQVAICFCCQLLF